MNALLPTSMEPDGSPKSFGQAEHHGISFARDFGHRFAQRGGGVEDASTIQMDGQSCFMGAIANIVKLLLRINRAAGHVVRVLQ